MKAFLLTAASVLGIAGSMFAQNLPPEYDWEIGINVGKSIITRPLGPAETYQGNKSSWVNDISLRLNYYATPHWLLNLDIGDRRWETQGTWQLNNKYGKKYEPRDVTFLVADHAINTTVGINYVIPFYSKYNTYNSSNVYFGASFGMIKTVNDGSTAYSTYSSAQDSGYVYASQYNYSFGIGYTYGVQMGITYYIIPRLGINLDLAVRYADVKTNDMNYREKNSSYHLLYFPQTLGIRWRF
jgi:hypothetical protein